MGSGAGRRAIVAGGSIGGLFTALQLRRHGWDAQVYERTDTPLTGRGAGIMTHPELRAALSDLGLDTERSFGTPVERRVTLDRDGRVIGERSCPQIATSWNRLYELLQAALPAGVLHLGRDLARVEQDANGVRACFADGSTADADLLVGADGFRSAVRAQFAPDVHPLYAGYVAWRGMVDEAAFPPDFHRAVFDSFAFCLPPGEQMLGYPVAGEGNDLRPGHRRYNFVWYRGADEDRDLPRLLTDERGRTHALSIPPPLIAGAVVAEMRAHAEAVLAPQLRTVVRLANPAFLQPIYDLETSAMAFGRVALVGDAAFVARPHVGAGVAKAVADAVSLAACLDREPGIAGALRAFESERMPVGRHIIRRARHLGAYLQTRFRTDEERAVAARHRTPEAVMAETALLDFLRD